MEQRLSEFNLELNKDKTRIVELNADNTLNFLGFNIYLRAKQTMFVTSLNKYDNKCQKITDVITSFNGTSYYQLVNRLNQILQGIYAYYAVSTNQIFLDNIYHHTVSELGSSVDTGSGVNEPAGSTLHRVLKDYPICKPPSELLQL